MPMTLEMDMEMDALGAGVETKGKSLIFYESPPDLEHLAALKVAAQLVFDELITVCKNFEDNLQDLNQIREWASLFRNDRNFRKTLLFPPKIGHKIFEVMRSIVLRVPDWIWHHFDLIDKIITRLTAELMQDFVWKWNGDVDYVLTAQNLIIGDKLSDRERIKMMCAYCLELDLEKKFELFDEVRNRMTDEEFHGNNHVFYWYARINGDKPVVSDDDDDRSFERFMLDTQCAFNLMAIDHHFLRLLLDDADNAFDFCQHELLRLHSFAVKFLITRMTEEEQIRLFELIPASNIIDRFVRDSCPHFALQLWNHVKYSMPGEQFVEMMKTTILKIHVPLPNDGYPRWLKELAMDIWKSTPSHLKQFVFQYGNESVIFEWDYWFCKKPIWRICEMYQDDSLLLEILSDADAEFKKKFWIREWDRLVVGCRPGFLRRFMFTCMCDLQEIREYERKISASKPMLMYLAQIFLLFGQEAVATLNEFFDFLAPDSNRRREMKVGLIDHIILMPVVIREPNLANNSVILDSLREFFHDIDQCGRMDFILRLFSLWERQSKTTLNQFPLEVFDNISLIAEYLCDQTHLHMIEKLKLSKKGVW